MNEQLPDVSIINYGINNLKSVSMAFKKLGKSFKIIESPQEVLDAKCLILPGIGAYGDGMEGLRSRGLIEPIRKRVDGGIPMLGICLGMQLLFSESEEFGIHAGLNLIPGRVIPFRPPQEVELEGYKVPHMGWNDIQEPHQSHSGTASDRWVNTLLESTQRGSDVFFVHSFYPVPEDEENILATSVHGNQEFCAVVKKKNVSGTQFHPEKSGIIGIQMLKSFCILHNI